MMRLMLLIGQKGSTGMTLVGGRSNIGIWLHTDGKIPLNHCNYVRLELVGQT
uniref:Uncharacterized protein n=1 Tax=Arundo donax TaxID=35708 RepID=A0A0A9H8I7_ARUDO